VSDNREKDGTFVELDVSRVSCLILFGDDERVYQQKDAQIALLAEHSKASDVYHEFKFMVSYLEAGRGTEPIRTFIQAIKQDINFKTHWQVSENEEVYSLVIISFLHDYLVVSASAGIATLGRKILVSLRTLYGKDEFFNKAEATGIFKAEGALERTVVAGFVRNYGDMRPKVGITICEDHDQKRIHIAFTGVSISGPYLAETCGVPTVLVALLSSGREEAIPGAASPLLRNDACHVLWSLCCDSNRYFSLVPCPRSSRKIIIMVV